MNPWKALHPDVVLTEAHIPERGRYYHSRRAIVLRKGMSLVEQRATLIHEVIHAERGDEVCSEKTDRNHVEREAARRAINVRDLAEALMWSEQPGEVADELKTTEELLAIRLQHLHPAERGFLRRRLSMREDTA